MREPGDYKKEEKFGDSGGETEGAWPIRPPLYRKTLYWQAPGPSSHGEMGPAELEMGEGRRLKREVADRG